MSSLKAKCPETLLLDGGDPWLCDRKAGHKGKHRETFYGSDGKTYVATMKWRRP